MEDSVIVQHIHMKTVYINNGMKKKVRFDGLSAVALIDGCVYYFKLNDWT